MDGAAAASSLGVLLQILFLDLLLSGDNALVIAMACRRLPEAQARQAALLGAGGAILLRLVLTLMTGVLLSLPFLQLLSALPLLVIALNLMAEDGDDDAALAGSDSGASSMFAAASIIIVSDAAMSLDNVVALAAVSGGSFWLLALGLAVSIPLIVFGSLGFSRLMASYPWIADLGGAMLGWIAGQMMAGDPLLSGWIRTQAPALEFVLPLACASFVLFQGRFARERARREQAMKPRPARRIAPVASASPAVASVSTAPAVQAPPAVVQQLPAAVAAPAVAPPLARPVPGEAPRAPDPAVAENPDAAADPLGDRWMIFGLIALFAVFGAFLAVFVAIPD